MKLILFLCLLTFVFCVEDRVYVPVVKQYIPKTLNGCPMTHDGYLHEKLWFLPDIRIAALGIYTCQDNSISILLDMAMPAARKIVGDAIWIILNTKENNKRIIDDQQFPLVRYMFDKANGFFNGGGFNKNSMIEASYKNGISTMKVDNNVVGTMNNITRDTYDKVLKAMKGYYIQLK